MTTPRPMWTRTCRSKRRAVGLSGAVAEEVEEQAEEAEEEEER